LSLSDLDDTARKVLHRAGALFTYLVTPTMRLGVTGLSRAGKTVFITALIRNLVSGGRLPFFSPEAEGRIERVYLEPQPDDKVPRFDYEAHLETLGSDPPAWPESTRRLSQLRITIEYLSANPLVRAFGPSRLNLDIVDYPGEWLIDLPLLQQSYETWSAAAVAQAREPRHLAHAKPWLDVLDTIDPYAPEDEQAALKGTRLFCDYLLALRSSDHVLHMSGPGRFLMPGDLEGSPLLTFFPLPLEAKRSPTRGSLAAMMARRFESYKSHVVRPFFRDHFARLDRQIVLVDLLGPLNEGGPPLADLQRALDGVLSAFRTGASTWLASLLGRRIDKLLFAATKADHIHSSSHDRLEAILRLVTERAMGRATSTGSEVGVQALAALQATREAEAKDGHDLLPCIVGVPLPGERVGTETFDGVQEAAIFPGDLPEDPKKALSPKASPAGLHFVRFRPPRVMPPGADGEAAPLPQIRLDRALDFLLSDWLT
jgi:predicted YcjX-like family ATPase